MVLMIKNQLDGTDKLRELILYICVACDADPYFGSTKLNKLLFFSDFAFFGATGRPISGAEYQKLENGPAPRIMKPLLDDMQERRELAIADRDRDGLPQKRPVALREPNLADFSAREIACTNERIIMYWMKSAKAMSRMSHNYILGWEPAELHETIPYGIELVDSRPLTAEEKSWAREIDVAEIQALMSA